MNTDLTSLTGFPLSQPYNLSPWNYTGTESVARIPENVADWVPVKLRDTPCSATATAGRVIRKRMAICWKTFMKISRLLNNLLAIFQYNPSSK